MNKDVTYPWYSIIADDTLAQGDILFGLEIPDIQQPYCDENDEYEVVLQTMDVVVMTQTCDLVNNKARSVVLCPVTSLQTFIDEAVKRGEHHWRKTEFLEGLRQGNVPGFHLLSDCSLGTIEFPLSVVAFRELYSAPTEQLRNFIKRTPNRLRLCPPYREHLAQAFARFFMRVGLPVDIPREKIRSSL